MDAQKCDRCGDFYDDSSFQGRKIKNIKQSVCIYSETYGRYTKMDLCPICLESFAVWWNCPMNAPEVTPNG